MNKKLKNGDILLLFLYVDNKSSIVGRTRLQKMAYVFEQELKKQYGFDKATKDNKNLCFNFSAYNYGPFSKEVFDLMEFFVNIEMIKVKYCTDDIEEAVDSVDDQIIFNDDMQGVLEDDDSQPGDPVYTISEKGELFVRERLLNLISTEQLQALTELKSAFNRYSLNQILKYVYSKYPDMTTNSLIKEVILENKWRS